MLIGLFLAFNYSTACAGDWYVVPQLNLEAGYDSNINFSFSKIRSDFIFDVSPSVDFKYDSEVTKLTGILALKGLLYVKNPNLDTINQYYIVAGQHKVAPRLALTFNGRYTLDTTLFDELQASGFVMNRTRRQALGAAPGLEFNLTERALLQTGYAFNRVIYQDPRFTDYTQHRINAGLNYLLKNAKTTISGTILFRFINYPSIENFYRNLGTYAGLEHKFTEEWSVSLFGGLNYNWFSSQTAVLDFGFFPSFFQVRQVKEETFTVSPFFNIAATRRWPKTNLTFGYAIDQSASGGGTVLQFHRMNAELSYNFSERLRGGIRGSLYYSNATSPGSDYDNLVVYVSPEIRYRFTEKISVNSSYRYGWRKDFVRERTTDRHLVRIYLSYANPIHYKK
jgi:hypothetical protein